MEPGIPFSTLLANLEEQLEEERKANEAKANEEEQVRRAHSRQTNKQLISRCTPSH